MQPYFTDNEYNTPEDTPHFWGDKLALKTRFYFLARYLAIVSYARVLVARGRFDAIAYMKTNWRIFKLIEGCNGRFHITGLDNLRNCTGPVVFVSNHMSNIESNTFGVMIRPYLPLTFVVKETLLKFPIFGPVLKTALNPIPVGRDNPREDLQFVLQEGVKRLQKGVSIIVFPQSTRTVEFVAEKFNSLGVKLARRADVWVMPVALKTDFWGNGRSFWRDFGPINREQPIHIAFGEPFPVTGSGKEAHERVVAFIQYHLEKWTGASNP
jgi:1-acyl-sn-glycerol-3-phosphate acyltransferase